MGGAASTHAPNTAWCLEGDAVNFCPACGHRLGRADARFCDECGESLAPSSGDSSEAGPFEFGVVKHPDLAEAVWRALRVPTGKPAPISRQQMATLTDELVVTSFGDTPIELNGLEHAINLVALDLQGFRPWNLEPLRGLSSLRRLRLASLSGSDLSPLAALPCLTELSLSSARASDLRQLAGLRQVTDLSLQHLQDAEDLAAIVELSHLSGLELDWPAHGSDLSTLTSLKGLRRLTIRDLYADQSDPVDITHLASLGQLTHLTLKSNVEGAPGLADIPSLEPIAALSGLKDVILTGFRQVSELDPLRALSNLETLELRGLPKVNALQPISQLPGLTTLTLGGAMPASDLSPLQHLTQLRDLHLYELPVWDISWMSSLRELQALRLQVLPIETLQPLAGLTRLNDLWVYGGYSIQTPVTSVRPLAEVPNLKTLRLGRVPVTDISPLAQLTRLTHLSLWQMPVEDLRPLEGMTGLTIEDKRRG